MAAPLCEADLEQGRAEYRRHLRQIARARDSGIWPSYASPAQWSLPAWARHDAEVLTLTIHGKQVTL